MKNVFLLGLAGVLGIGMAGTALAAQEGAMPMNMDGMRQAPASASAISAIGVVRQVKLEAGKVKITHEPIAALDWPAMTMDFRVKDKAMLKGIGTGDKVTFQLGKDARGMVITEIKRTAP